MLITRELLVVEIVASAATTEDVQEIESYIEEKYPGSEYRIVESLGLSGGYILTYHVNRDNRLGDEDGNEPI